MPLQHATLELLRHLAGRRGHDEVKADFRQLLIEEFGADLNELDFEKWVPEVHGRLDALSGRTVFEAKRNLDREWGDVERRMPDYLADRERETGDKFVGIASDGLKWVVFERSGDALVKVKETTLDADKGEQFLAWLDGALALKKALSPDPIYWTHVATEAEGNYLAAVFNSETALGRTAAYQSRGAWGARDFDEVMFNLPIPRFDEKQKVHRDLAAAAQEAERLAAAVALPENVKFQRARKLIRDALAEAGVSQHIDGLVALLLDGPSQRQT